MNLWLSCINLDRRLANPSMTSLFAFITLGIRIISLTHFGRNPLMLTCMTFVMISIIFVSFSWPYRMSLSQFVVNYLIALSLLPLILLSMSWFFYKHYILNISLVPWIPLHQFPHLTNLNILILESMVLASVALIDNFVIIAIVLAMSLRFITITVRNDLLVLMLLVYTLRRSLKLLEKHIHLMGCL